MKPITFACARTLGLTPEEIVQQILDVTKSLDFKGYGPLPGIRAAEFEVRTPAIVVPFLKKQFDLFAPPTAD